MKTVKKEIRLGELLPTMILVQKLLGVGDGMDEIKNEKGRQEVLRLMSLGILKGVDPKNRFGKTPEELEKVKMSGLANHEYDIKVLVDKIGVEGYSPDKHTHIKVYKGNNIIYGTPIFQALKKLYGEDYMVEVMEVIED